MSSKKPAVVFEVVFSGPGIYPELIPLGTMSRILSAVHALATGSELPEEEEEQSDEPTAQSSGNEIQLLDVKRGSAVLRFSGMSPAPVLNNLREFGLVLRHPERIGQNIRMLRPIEDLSATARKLNCTIKIKKPSKDDGELAIVDSASYENISKSIFVDGETSITGRVERVGGATRVRCGLRVPFQRRMFICGVKNRDVARMLGEKVYQEVIVRGNAKWIKSTWRLYKFDIENVQQLISESIDESFQALRKAGGSAWDKIESPGSFLEQTGNPR
jgi:hypothetical protein